MAQFRVGFKGLFMDMLEREVKNTKEEAGGVGFMIVAAFLIYAMLAASGCSTYGGQIVLGWAPINAIQQSQGLDNNKYKKND